MNNLSNKIQLNTFIKPTSVAMLGNILQRVYYFSLLRKIHRYSGNNSCLTDFVYFIANMAKLKMFLLIPDKKFYLF